jgi:hypothetical protein
MRANEFIVESMKEFSPEQLAAIPGMQKIPSLDNSNPYHMWRFIVAAGALDGKGNGYKLDLEGPLGQKLNTMTYTKEDGEIINATAKALGLKVEQVSSQESSEPDFIHKQSPVQGFKGYKRR